MVRLTPFNRDQAAASITYDRAGDTLHVRFAPQGTPIAETREVADHVLLDFDAEGAVLGGEVLSARALLGPEPDRPSEDAPYVMNGVRLRRFDLAEYLTDTKSQEEFLADALETAQAAYIARALDIIARARATKKLVDAKQG